MGNFLSGLRGVLGNFLKVIKGVLGSLKNLPRGFQSSRLGARASVKVGRPLSPSPGRLPTCSLFGKLTKIPAIALNMLRGFQMGRGLIPGKINRPGELFKNPLRGPQGTFKMI